jgi:hypothetical protein
VRVRPARENYPADWSGQRRLDTVSARLHAVFRAGQELLFPFPRKCLRALRALRGERLFRRAVPGLAAIPVQGV